MNVIGSLLSTTTGVKSLTIRDGSAAVCSESNPIYEPADGLGGISAVFEAHVMMLS